MEDQTPVQTQLDNTPKWVKWAVLLFAIGSCATPIASFIGLFGDAPGQCIKNRSYTNNYRRRLNADFAYMVKRDQYYQKRRNNG